MTVLPRHRADSTADDSRARDPKYLAVVEDEMIAVLPALPVVGDASAVLKRVDETIAVDASEGEAVPLESGFDPASDEGSLALRGGDVFVVC